MKDDTDFLDKQIASLGDNAFHDVLDDIRNRNPGTAYQALQLVSALLRQHPNCTPARGTVALI